MRQTKILIIGTAMLLILSATPTVSASDDDGDGIDDDAEAALCGREAVRTLISEANDTAPVGECRSSTDYDGVRLDVIKDLHCSGESDPTELVGRMVVDFDCDGGPNGQETLAGCNPIDAEDEGYRCDPDQIPDDVEPYLCFVEDQNTDLDGSCSDDDYRGPPICDDVNAVLGWSPC